MGPDEQNYRYLRIRIEEELLNRIREEAQKQETDMATYIRWCLRTGVYLENLNLFLQSKIDDE